MNLSDIRPPPTIHPGCFSLEQTPLTTKSVVASNPNQGCRRYGDSHGASHEYGYGMGLGTVINLHGSMEIL